MALNKSKLTTDLLSALKRAFKFEELPAGEEKQSAEEQYQELAEQMSTAIDDYIRSGSVNTKVTTILNINNSTGEGTGEGNIT